VRLPSRAALTTSPSPRTDPRGAPRPSGLDADRAIDIDCVYMLMFPGWERELRSNRWHYASRWAKHRPVVLVQPTESGAGMHSRLEERIPDCRVLHVAAAVYAPGYLPQSVRQSAQILADMRAHGHSRPLLWLYNPELAASYGSLPAVCRLFHATENYFELTWTTPFFLAQTRAALAVSDLVVAVSDGVGASIAHEMPAAKVRTVTNGCDYHFYANAAPDPGLSNARKAFERVAVYAGNINRRLDFRLIARCARKWRRTLFALYGPVVALAGHDRADWKALGELPNVRHYAAVAPEALPGIYAAADLGLVPYKHEPWIVHGGFPLKVLEMAAAGLPVVATLMKPIENVAAAVEVCADADAFVRAAGERSRASLLAAERDELRRVCERNDYDLKFHEIASMVAAVARGANGPSERGTEVRSALPAVQGARAYLHSWLRGATKFIPVGLRSKIFPGARRVIRNWLER
jgi:glycosyltransferase involved in cell wall biosynthesis